MPGLRLSSFRKIMNNPTKPAASAITPSRKCLILCLSDAFDNFTPSALVEIFVSEVVLTCSCENVYFWFIDGFLLD